MTDLNKITEMTHRAVKELRDVVEAKKSADIEKIEKIEKHLDSLEAENQKLVAKISEQKSMYEDLEKKYTFLDASFSSMPVGGSSKELDKEYKQAMLDLNLYSKYGIASYETAKDIERWNTKYLRTDSNTEGGFLVPTEFVADIIKDITEVSPVRSVCLVRTANSKTMEQPIRTALVSAGWAGEGEDGTVSNSTYGDRKIHVKKLIVQVEITREMLQDAAFDMESEIRSDVVERFAQVEGYAHVKGTGVNSPIGFMTASDVPEINSGLAADISFDNFFDLPANLKTGYGTTSLFGFNRFTLGRIRKLKGSDGHYLWTAGNLAAGVPNSIAGHSYIELPDMDSIGAAKYPVIFADFRRFYQIADRLSMEVVRDDYTKAKSAKVLFTFVMRTGADVRQPEAGVKLKCSV